ncbi:fumarylacetoacetate hydrolase family protein [Meiothermus taiwanensis]|jgi:5-oxopent-3-ene-1,2,5-tricarboxylate decarboxylase/2-hydroxyhepta-2,4-diene-1,7-dioate isomerase|uniref:Homoprotocatechuate catabolism bifunctional isomerase/decarboxylase n=2 Tax=Meiothermus taiwanensis TaxID=172827 RepID=A0A399E3V6_9DEIN|nr:fumarylacetoacetate hydrolase family protein [Meiothermus taiwanensis]AWR86880.1 4-hydroxyphenylacetate degradation bifunctional isomerase/decarboxylase, HpaG2 subunit [Meiothermus taiwanensis WR-220]KIQ54200.1 2-hydroxyhepta-2,4-diene-1,7-dioate isomerase [Meiothermus taiwanensis]KZK14773.1 2-hydroxyhepta-2,4-diene-1,7-dioate isomerase [Meiothermus taiwanensis]RIH79414.1 Homoprotocatechuate catabolism bifunctional isomerase/decarboxylase [Meiothermus taiwanensis]
MKLARFISKGRTLQGYLQDGMLLDHAGEAHHPDAVQWLLPVEPGKVIALALNFAEHAEEFGLRRPSEPALFWKPNTSLLPHKGTVIYPRGARFMHFECELAVIIGRHARRVKAKDAMDYVGGYTIANDLVVRDYVSNTFRPPIRAKGWDTFGPLGPFYVTADEIPDPHNLRMRAYVNGELRQEATTQGMIFSIPEIIEFISRFMTLEPGDVLLTGTPKGISQVHPGDLMRMEIEGLGALENNIEWETEEAEPLISEEGDRSVVL